MEAPRHRIGGWGLYRQYGGKKCNYSSSWKSCSDAFVGSVQPTNLYGYVLADALTKPKIQKHGEIIGEENWIHTGWNLLGTFGVKWSSITSLRMIPTMTFIHFLTGKSSGILSDISSGILSGILSGISSGICSGISSGKSSGILSGKSSGILSGISSGILSDILSGISSDIFSGILSGISSDILSDISSDILSGISSDILSGISSDILSDILSGILSGISSDILSDIFSSRWGPAVPTAIWKSRLRSGSAHCDLEVAVEVRQCPLGSGARGCCDLEVAVEVRQCLLRSATRGWGPAVPTGIGPAVPTGIWTARRRRTRRRRMRRRRRTALIKSNNPHLAGGEKIFFQFSWNESFSSTFGVFSKWLSVFVGTCSSPPVDPRSRQREGAEAGAPSIAIPATWNLNRPRYGKLGIDMMGIQPVLEIIMGILGIYPPDPSGNKNRSSLCSVNWKPCAVEFRWFFLLFKNADVHFSHSSSLVFHACGDWWFITSNVWQENSPGSISQEDLAHSWCAASEEDGRSADAWPCAAELLVLWFSPWEDHGNGESMVKMFLCFLQGSKSLRKRELNLRSHVKQPGAAKCGAVQRIGEYIPWNSVAKWWAYLEKWTWRCKWSEWDYTTAINCYELLWFVPSCSIPKTTAKRVSRWRSSDSARRARWAASTSTTSLCDTRRFWNQKQCQRVREFCQVGVEFLGLVRLVHWFHIAKS